jgi:hypothetical protein
MPKFGILHDYDLKANEEKSAYEKRCAVCGEFPMVFQWSDYSGEAMCMKCGCPYQLKWGGEKREKEGNYPYLNFSSDFMPVAVEYWEEKQKFVCYGTMMGPQPGMSELIHWLKINHPEHIQKAD